MSQLETLTLFANLCFVSITNPNPINEKYYLIEYDMITANTVLYQ